MPGSSDNQRSTGSATSHSLILRLQDDDAPAWRELVHLYSPLILYWCRKQGAHERDCEDILQDVFRTVVNNIGRFRNDKPSSTFRGWLRTLTRSRLADFYRRRAAEPDASGGTDANVRLGQIAEQPRDSDDEEPDDGAPNEERQLFLRAIELIRDDFKPETWQAFWRTAVDGCSARDVADELSMRPGTVRVAKSRVLQRLRDRLGDVME
jgi:RNA polymerase sigma-70 factor, ECF subfamily